VIELQREDGSNLIDRLFAESDAEFVISDISIIEFYSALSLLESTNEEYSHIGGLGGAVAEIIAEEAKKRYALSELHFLPNLPGMSGTRLTCAASMV